MLARNGTRQPQLSNEDPATLLDHLCPDEPADGVETVDGHKGWVHRSQVEPLP